MLWKGFFYCGSKALVNCWQPSWAGISLGMEAVKPLFLNILLVFLCKDCPLDPWWISHSVVFRRKVCHSSSLFSSITALRRCSLQRGEREKVAELFTLFLSSRYACPPPRPLTFWPGCVGGWGVNSWKCLHQRFRDGFGVCRKEGVSLVWNPGGWPCIVEV